jgi:hypothetical protein
MSYWTRVYCKCGFLMMHCNCKVNEMQKLDMTDYVPTPLPNVPKLGWDDRNAKEYTCANCNGLVGVPGRIYGLVATWCMCGNPSRFKNDGVSIQKLFDEIKHGDQDHQNWLKVKLEDFFNTKLK